MSGRSRNPYGQPGSSGQNPYAVPTQPTNSSSSSLASGSSSRSTSGLDGSSQSGSSYNPYAVNAPLNTANPYRAPPKTSGSSSQQSSPVNPYATSTMQPIRSQSTSSNRTYTRQKSSEAIQTAGTSVANASQQPYDVPLTSSKSQLRQKPQQPSIRTGSYNDSTASPISSNSSNGPYYNGYGKVETNINSYNNRNSPISSSRQPVLPSSNSDHSSSALPTPEQLPAIPLRRSRSRVSPVTSPTVTNGASQSPYLPISSAPPPLPPIARSHTTRRTQQNPSDARREQIGISNINDVLKFVERDWNSLVSEDCNPIAVALELMDTSSVGRASEIEDFKDLSRRLENIMYKISDENRDGFEKSLVAYQSILQKIKEAEQRVKILKDLLIKAKQNLTSKQIQLESLGETSQKYKEMLKLLDNVEKTQNLPEKITFGR
ncbi:Sec8 exocyst complex component-specific domain-containing protein [Dipodascopsis uninucleata]